MVMNITKLIEGYDRYYNNIKTDVSGKIQNVNYVILYLIFLELKRSIVILNNTKLKLSLETLQQQKLSQNIVLTAHMFVLHFKPC